jgi:hypothetical protein
MQPLVRAPLNVAVQNLELIASWPTIACGQTSHVARAPVGVATSVTRCSRSVRERASGRFPMDICATGRVIVAHA